MTPPESACARRSKKRVSGFGGNRIGGTTNRRPPTHFYVKSIALLLKENEHGCSDPPVDRRRTRRGRRASANWERRLASHCGTTRCGHAGRSLWIRGDRGDGGTDAQGHYSSGGWGGYWLWNVRRS